MAYEFAENIRDLVYAKDYAQVIRLTENGGLDRDEIIWRADNLHRILLADVDRLYDIFFWRNHCTALRAAVVDTNSAHFHHALQTYLRQLKTLGIRDIIRWSSQQIVASVKEDRYHVVAAICRGVIKSGYVPIEPEVVFWIGLEAVLQDRSLATLDNVQLELVAAFINSVAEVDSDLAHDAYMKAYRDNETQSIQMLQQATSDNAVGQLGSYEIRWPGFTTLRIAKQDTLYRRAEIDALASQVARDVVKRYLANFADDVPKIAE